MLPFNPLLYGGNSDGGAIQDFYISNMDARPAPPREKQVLPRPAEIDKTRGAQRGKATIDTTDYAHTFGLRVGKLKEKLFIWSFVQLVIIWFAGRPFTVRECDVFLHQNTIL